MTSTDQPISPLRQRFIEDMTARKLGEKTQSAYVRAVKQLADFLGRSPAGASAEDLRQFQLHLAESGVGSPTLNATLTALRFFFDVTLERAGPLQKTHHVYEPRRLPVVLSPEEVTRLLLAAPGPKYRAALAAAYGAGLRVSEVCTLKVCDVDSSRMVLRIEQGKGHKDRYAMLSPVLLELLRAWWRLARANTCILPGGWLFPSSEPVNPISTRQMTRACHAAAQAAGIAKRVSPHTLRHSFATHLLEQKVDIRVIQVLLGHKRLETTSLYTQVASRTLREVTSPLDRLSLDGRLAA